MTFFEPFDYGPGANPNWTWPYPAYQTVVNDTSDPPNKMLKSTGTGSSWNANFYRASYNLSSGNSMHLRSKMDSTDPAAIFAIETGSGGTYCRLGIWA